MVSHGSRSTLFVTVLADGGLAEAGVLQPPGDAQSLLQGGSTCSHIAVTVVPAAWSSFRTALEHLHPCRDGAGVVCVQQEEEAANNDSWLMLGKQ